MLHVAVVSIDLFGLHLDWIPLFFSSGQLNRENNLKLDSKCEADRRISATTARSAFAQVVLLLDHLFDRLVVPAAGSLYAIAGLRLSRCRVRYRRLWRWMTPPFRLYVTGSALMLLWFACCALAPGASWVEPLMFAGGVAFVGGFYLWCNPILGRFAEARAGVWLPRIMHGFFVVFAIGIARSVVGEALDQPPHYYELTVSLVALLTYIPVCLGAAILTMLVFFLVMFVFWGLGGTLINFVQLYEPFFRNADRARRLARRRRRQLTKAFFHAMGAMACIFVLAALLDGFFAVSRYSQPAIRWFAYVADFQKAGSYPGVPCNARIRLQDNGVIAVAEMVSGVVTIVQKEFRPSLQLGEGCRRPVTKR